MFQRIKKSLLVRAIPATANVSSAEIEESFRSMLYETVAPLRGSVSECWLDLPVTNPRYVWVTIYWVFDPFDRDPNPPYPEKTDVYLRQLVPTLREALASYAGVTIELVTNTQTRETLHSGDLTVETS